MRGPEHEHDYGEVVVVHGYVRQGYHHDPEGMCCTHAVRAAYCVLVHSANQVQTVHVGNMIEAGIM